MHRLAAAVDGGMRLRERTMIVMNGFVTDNVPVE